MRNDDSTVLTVLTLYARSDDQYAQVASCFPWSVADCLRSPLVIDIMAQDYMIIIPTPHVDPCSASMFLAKIVVGLDHTCFSEKLKITSFLE